MAKYLQCGRFRLGLERPLIMGVLNVTPDSFSDGGRFLRAEAALSRARAMVDEGADLVDIGGESTRPGAAPVSAAEEIDRVMPVLESLRDLGVPLSLDTRRAEVMREGLRLGADLINDVGALEAEGALELVARSAAAVCLMHKKGEPATMQLQPHYDDVVDEVAAYLRGRVQQARSAGIDEARLLVDPGFGFGKNLTHNLTLLAHLDRLGPWPVLVGLSRKSMLGAITGRPVDQRLAASVAAAMLAAQRGAAVIRVHDVEQTRDALLVLQALESA